MNKKTGAALDEIEHIKQSVNDILSTPLGSRIMRREYGSALPDLIDKPLNNATLLQCYAATAIALAQFEPRINLTKATMHASTTAPGKAQLTLEATRLVGGEQIKLTLPL